MNSKLRKTLISSAMVALITTPVWAASDAAEREIPRAQPGQSQSGPDAEAPRSVGPADTPPMGVGPAGPVSDSPLHSRTPDELKGFDVVGAEGEKVGDIKAVVLGPERENPRVVIGVGGFLGLGERDIIVSLDELTLIEDKLRISATKDELVARDDYVKVLFVELESDRPISEFSVVEPISD